MNLKETFALHELSEKVSIFSKDPDYIIKDAGTTKNDFIVTSWTHGKSAENIYFVSKGGTKWTCNCPDRTPNCKHIQMVKQWLKDGKPSLFLDKEADDELRRLLSRKGVKT